MDKESEKYSKLDSLSKADDTLLSSNNSKNSLRHSISGDKKANEVGLKSEELKVSIEEKENSKSNPDQQLESSNSRSQSHSYSVLEESKNQDA